MMVTVIGRGHSGTRAMSHTLSASGVYMGEPLNDSGDLLPPEAMYEACRVMARYVRWKGGLEWDFSALHTMDIPAEFTDLIHAYLKTVLQRSGQHRGWKDLKTMFHRSAPHQGWKIPETTLVYPWIQRMFPDIRYIFWIRDPRDCIIGGHVTDDLANFGIDYPRTDDVRRRRAISWKYQYDLVRATPKPTHWLEVRFEDFVLRQAETLVRLEHYLGIPLARIPVRPETLERWRTDAETHDFDFFAPAMREYGYAAP